jgi:hypothetical protein
MGLLETTMELAKIAGQVANPELVREAMKANVEALELSRENLELQKRVTELEGTIARLQSKSDLTARVYRLGCYVFAGRRSWSALLRLLGQESRTDPYRPCATERHAMPHLPFAICHAMATESIP